MGSCGLVWARVGASVWVWVWAWVCGGGCVGVGVGIYIYIYIYGAEHGYTASNTGQSSSRLVHPIPNLGGQRVSTRSHTCIRFFDIVEGTTGVGFALDELCFRLQKNLPYPLTKSLRIVAVSFARVLPLPFFLSFVSFGLRPFFLSFSSFLPLSFLLSFFSFF